MRKPSRRSPRPREGHSNARSTARPAWSNPHAGLSRSSSSAIAPLSRRPSVFGPALPPVGGTGGLRHRGPRRETGEELWRQLVRPGEPGDETWGEVPYEDSVHAESWAAPSVDLDLNLVFPPRGSRSAVPEGRSLRMRINATPLRAEGGDIRSVVVTMQDIPPLDAIERRPPSSLSVFTAFAPAHVQGRRPTRRLPTWPAA